MKNNKTSLTIKDSNNILNKPYPHQDADIWDNVGYLESHLKIKR